MKILYFCNVRKSNPTESGVLKKVVAQCNVMRKEGHIVYLACQDGEGNYTILNEKDEEIHRIVTKDKVRFFRSYITYAELLKFVIAENISVLYSRYSNFSMAAHMLYSKLKKQGVHCLLEIPTYPLTQRWLTIYQNLKTRKFKIALIQLYNSTIGTLGIFFFRFSIERIVNNNGFNRIWGIPVISITNGIDVSLIKKRSHEYEANKKSIIVFSVANIARWHGFDRFIKGLPEYYRQQRDLAVKLILAGPGEEVNTLRKLAKELNVEQYVTFVGPVLGESLDELYEQADLGISILGIHRSGMDTIDCLKSREFCARKLPFITQSAEKHFNGCRFALQFPSDESPINIERVVDFYKKISVDKSVFEEMYTFAQDKCDWKYAFKNVITYLNGIEDGRE